MSYLVIALSLVQVYICSASCTGNYNLQVERGVRSSLWPKCNDYFTQTPCIQHRSGASDGVAVHLGTGQNVSFEITLLAQCVFVAENVLYSNNGEEDRISIFMNHKFIGEFHTLAKSGSNNLWNVFDNSRIIGTAQTFDPGNYNFTVRVSEADNKGVELDVVNLMVRCSSDACPVVLPPHSLSKKETSKAAVFVKIFVPIATLIVSILGVCIGFLSCILCCHK